MQKNHLQLSISQGIATLVFNMHGSTANTLSKSVLEELETLLNSIKNDTSVKVLLLKSAKEDMFIAGADIKEILPMTNEEEIYTYLMKVHSIFTTLETLPYPSVAVINGACMGGGLELALC
jgi:3-hydroxyacyl-CoA dehydrogenase/enoyl-CoA hydratase/3-hydroxybutyryl-CoA epimerase